MDYSIGFNHFFVVYKHMRKFLSMPVFYTNKYITYNIQIDDGQR